MSSQCDFGPTTNRTEAMAVAVDRRFFCVCAVELGVNFIDTADSSRPDASEKSLLHAVHSYSNGPLIARKGGWVVRN